MKKTAPTPKKPVYTAKLKKCKYCEISFTTKATYHGSIQKFCTDQHRVAFHKQGHKPIGAILNAQEKRMRTIVVDELAKREPAIIVSVVTYLQEKGLLWKPV